MKKEEKTMTAVEAMAACGGIMSAAARMRGMPRSTFQHKLRRELKIPTEVIAENQQIHELKHRVKKLGEMLAEAKKHNLSSSAVRSKILRLTSAEVGSTPAWLTKPNIKSDVSPSVPTLFLSDIHYAEVINPLQIGGVNEYNTAIAKERIERVVATTIQLCSSIGGVKYPGVVLALGGDMVSGDIHDELAETNEVPLIPSVLELADLLVDAIEALAKTFGKVFVPCVTGNHGRNTQKIRSKDRAHTSFDWLLYMLIARHFKKDSRITVYIPEGSDALYKVFGHRYLLTHGDQFRGGDGIIGCIGPIIRGDQKKRVRNAAVGASYDTMLLGHWHQLISTKRLIVNGSVCGYNEYAYSGNFSFEQPCQALWITSDRGITFSMPVFADNQEKKEVKSSWVSIPG